jgi:hypothetical protein
LQVWPHSHKRKAAAHSHVHEGDAAVSRVHGAQYEQVGWQAQVMPTELCKIMFKFDLSVW